MRSRLAARCVSALVAWTYVGTATAVESAFRFADRTLTVATDRYDVTWRDGCMVALDTFLPKQAELTLPDAPMQADQLPNGLGSLHGHEAEARAVHHPWSFAAPGPACPAQHPPFAESDVRYEPIDGGARLTYTGLRGDPKGSLVQELTVDGPTGDLVIRQRASSPDPGLYGIAFSLLSLRPDVELAVPYFGGQRWGPEFTRGRLITVGWPQFWSAGLVVGQVPGGGVFAVWAEDPAMRPKYFRCLHSGDALALGFEACEEAPFEARTEARAFDWRFNTFGGSWTEPAARYKAWMVEARQLVPRAKRAPRWASEIALVWPESPTEAELDAMAKLIEPGKVLIQHWGWLEGFNRRLPEYVPRDKGFAERVAAERRRGYHSCAYTSMALVDQQAFPTMMADCGLDYQFHAPWQPRQKKTEWLVYVHPGSARWRAFYADRMAEAADKYGLDCLYQDVSGCGTGSSGLIEGRNFHQAVVACEEAIRSRLPQVALAGEFWDEVNACREDFGLQNFLKWDPGAKWDGASHREVISRPGQPHPILSYLFSDFCLHWPHQVPIRDTRMFHQDQNINEAIGAIPVWTTTVDDLSGEAGVMLARARLWAAGFRPWFPKRWDPAVAAWMRSPGGRTVKYERRGESTFCIEATGGAERLVYARVTGVPRVEVNDPCRIDGWIAYGKEGPIGLDSEQWYCLLPGAPRDLPLAVTSLPEGARVAATRLTDSYWLVGLDGAGAGTAAWQAARPFLWLSAGGAQHPASLRELSVTLPATLLFALAEPASVRSDQPLPLEAWQQSIVGNGRLVKAAAPPRKGTFTAAGVSHGGVMVAPPLGGKGSERSIDALVRIPDSPNAALRASLGLVGSSGDGVHYVVRVNGREVWRRFRETKPGWEDAAVPLGDYAGQAVVLSLAVDCGPGGFNTSCDDVVWAEARITIGKE